MLTKLLFHLEVATTPTACGIETKIIPTLLHHNLRCNNTYRLRYAPQSVRQQRSEVTMRPTHYLPERSEGKTKVISNSTYRLRYTPKGARRQRSKATMRSALLLPERREGKTKMMKQQYLPFTVLKRIYCACCYCNSTNGCNSTYCLRYAPKGARQQRSKATMRSAHLKYLNEVKVKQR